jgi:hypothetical protein
MKEERIHICIYLSKSPVIVDYYEGTFRTKSYGAERAAEIYPILREHALEEMKGVFLYEELELLVKILTLGKERFEISKDNLIKKINDSILLQPALTSKQKEMIVQIVKKIEKLGFSQAIVLSEWFSTFNSLSETYKGKKKSITFKKYAARLLE